jgi:hypothetical protein
MPKGTVTEAVNYPIPTETLCPAKLQSVDEVTVPFTYKKGDKVGQQGSFNKWTWTFKIYEGPYAGMTVEGSSEPNVTNADTPSGFLALARPWYETLLGRELRLGEAVDTDVLLGLPCQITVKHLDPRPKRDGDGFWFNTEVEDVLPAKKNADGTVAYDEPPF